MVIEKEIIKAFEPLEGVRFLSDINFEGAITNCSNKQRKKLGEFADAMVSYLLMMCDYYDEVYIPISDLAEKIGIKVFTENIDHERVSAFYVFDSVTKIIVLNSKDSIERQRFVTACVLGMYLFDHSHKKARVMRTFDIDEQFNHVNGQSCKDYFYLVFAVFLLIPEEGFYSIIKKILKVMNKDIDKFKRIIPFLMRKYSVPKEAMELRLNLMLLGDGENGKQK